MAIAIMATKDKNKGLLCNKHSLQGHQLGFGSIYLTQVQKSVISSVMEKKVYRHTDVQCARRRTMASAHAQSGIQEGGLVAQQQRKSK